MRSIDLMTPAGLRGTLLDEMAACVDRLDRLDEGDWSRPIRVPGRTVLDTVNAVAERLRRLEAELGSGLAVDAPHGTAASSPAEALAATHAAHDALFATLDAPPEHVDESKLLGPLLSTALAHHDVLHAVGAEQALRDAVATIAARSIAGILAAPIFEGLTRHPEQPIAYRLVAPTATTAVWSMGDQWHFGGDKRFPTCHINADDSSMLLFVTGRIAPGDLRLWVTGERELVWLFKDYFPGT